MNIKKYLFRFAVGAAAFFIGHSGFLIGHAAYAGAKQLMSDENPYIPEKSHQEAAHPVEVVTSLDHVSEFDDGEISGEYYLFDEALIKGFRDFDHFEIETTDNHGSPIPIRGLVQTKRDHKFTSVSLTRDRFTFETETIRGVSYRFNGKVDLAYPGEEDSSRAVRGKFTKLEAGKIVGSMYASFYPGGC